MPDPHGSPLFGFAPEGANALGVLADSNFLHHFPEGGAIMVPYLPTIPTFLVCVAMSLCTRLDAESCCFFSFFYF